MYAAFVKLLNMSAASGVLIAVILVLRFLFRKAPKKYICILWAIAALRLICPVSLSSPISAYNYIGRNTQPTGQVEYIHYNGKSEKPKAEIMLPAASESTDSSAVQSTTKDIYIPTLLGLWACGAAILAIYAAISYHRIRLQVRESIRLHGNLYLCDCIPTPFILGIFKPRIYLPSTLNERQQNSVIAHERAHLARFDHLWKPLGYGILCIHWFNPMVWLAYIYLCRDIEMACDEKVIRTMPKEQKQEYAALLLSCSMPRQLIRACPLAFGEADVKRRIRGILNYRKPAFWIIVAAIAACLTVAAVFLTNPLRHGDYLVFRNEQHRNATTPQTADYRISMGDTVERAFIHTELWQNGILTDGSTFALPTDIHDIHLNLTNQKKDYAIESYSVQITTNRSDISFQKTFSFPDETYPLDILSWSGPKDIALSEDKEILLAGLIFDRGKGFFLFEFDNEDYADAANRLQEQDCALSIWIGFGENTHVSPAFDVYWEGLRQAGLLSIENGVEIFRENVTPEAMVGITQEELDSQNGEWYQSAQILEDGSGIYKMTQQHYVKNLNYITDELERICQNTPKSYAFRNYISKITHNNDYTEFTITLKNGTLIDFDEEDINNYLDIFAQQFCQFTTGALYREITYHYQDADGNPGWHASPNYRLQIGMPGVTSITVYYRGRAYYGYGNGLAIPFSVGDSRRLPCLDGDENLQNVEILAKDADDRVIWSHKFTGDELFPWREGSWILAMNFDWLTIDTPLDIHQLVRATFLFDDQEIQLNSGQTAQLEFLLRNAQWEQSGPQTHSFNYILQIIQQDGRYRSISLNTDTNEFCWGGEYYQYEDEAGLIALLLPN